MTPSVSAPNIDAYDHCRQLIEDLCLASGWEAKVVFWCVVFHAPLKAKRQSSITVYDPGVLWRGAWILGETALTGSVTHALLASRQSALTWGAMEQGSHAIHTGMGSTLGFKAYMCIIHPYALDDYSRVHYLAVGIVQTWIVSIKLTTDAKGYRSAWQRSQIVSSSADLVKVEARNVAWKPHQADTVHALQTDANKILSFYRRSYFFMGQAPCEHWSRPIIPLWLWKNVGSPNGDRADMTFSLMSWPTTLSHLIFQIG